jgi:outer membrane protein OmpA-like peptidoglycan-associated protein
MMSSVAVLTVVAGCTAAPPPPPPGAPLPLSSELPLVGYQGAAPADSQRLRLENAIPLSVPPPPGVRPAGTVSPPLPFAPDTPVDVPPPPEMAALPTLAPPTPIANAPPLPPPTAPVLPARTMPAPPTAVPAPAKAAPPALPAMGADALTVRFDGPSTDIPTAAAPMLGEVARQLLTDEALRLQLRSYAGGTPDGGREARQLSLARALALRERLADMGVRSTRVDVRALGASGGDGPPDRIELEFLGR